MERDLAMQPETRLYDAAARGDERVLQELLQNDHLLLDRVSYTCSNKSALHVATIHGHLPIVQIILNHNPDLAQELDSHQPSALHVASCKGYLEIARELLSVAPDMCLSRDCQGRNPLHLASMKGHVEVLEELVRVYPMAAKMNLDRGMTALHLCVMYRQTETLKVLVHNFNEMVNAKNDDGETVLHMAVRDRQIETINFLLTVTSLEVNGLNLNGMTALNVLVQSKRDARDSEIEKSLTRAMEASDAGSKKNNAKHHDEWLDRKRGALMVAASLIATMAFQVGVNPPGGVWQEDGDVPMDIFGNSDQQAGFSILARNYPAGYSQFYVINTISFIASLSIILLLMSGLPLRRRFFMWFLMVITWIAITAIGLVYMYSLIYLSPVRGFSYRFEYSYWDMPQLGVIIWICLTGLLFIVNTTRLIVTLVKNLRKWLKKRKQNQRTL